LVVAGKRIIQPPHAPASPSQGQMRRAHIFLIHARRSIGLVGFGTYTPTFIQLINNLHMTIKISFLLLWLPIQLLLSQTQSPIRVDLEKALETTGECKLSSIASNVQYVPLEAKPGSFIKNVDRYTVSDDLILVADETVGKVMKFDRKGHFLGDFLTKGKGPKEFLSINGLNINSKGEILVLKNNLTIEIFSKSGELINGFDYYGFSTGRWLSDDKILLVMDYIVSKGSVIVTIDRNGKNPLVCLKTTLDISKIPYRPGFSCGRCAEGYYYFDPFIDTVYTINNKGEASIRCVFLHRKDHVNQKDMLSNANDEFLISGEKYQFLQYYEFKDKIILQGIVQRHNSVVVYDKKTGTGTSRLKTIYFGLINDLDKGPEFFPRITFTNGSAVQLLRQQEDLIHYIDWVFPESGMVKKGSYDIDLYKKLADYGNPVLMIVR
jgi:hypothetical protein